ncbi:MAG: signal recognition particle protein Srp19 [Thermoprotei archaeon]|nr:MAG: signal recognition particle protein Srp19 [Thermoprotei archaeon]RLF03584.1 MAG: signal recognition particle protein Srp19 [Thermoprotei archaeon]
MRNRDYYILWPVYFDKNRSRREGRRVPLNLAVENPSVDEISFAVKKMGLEPVVERDKAHPTTWFELKGRVLVRKDSYKFNKNHLVRNVGKILCEMRRRRK